MPHVFGQASATVPCVLSLNLHLFLVACAATHSQFFPALPFLKKLGSSTQSPSRVLDGDCIGALVGLLVGLLVGDCLGVFVGDLVGDLVGGGLVGGLVGGFVGLMVGANLGERVGDAIA